MASVNKVILLGHLGRDPETRYTAGGDPVCNFSLATTETWKDKNGEKQEKTEWHRVSAWGKLAEICGEYLKKGHLVYIEGRIRTSKYTDKDGVERESKDIVCETMKLMPNQRDGGNRGGGDQQRSAPANSGGGKKQTDDFDDDIPF